MTGDPLVDWRGEFGDAYTDRHIEDQMGIRIPMWKEILKSLPQEPISVLEVGANIGLNLDALVEISPIEQTLAVEPNPHARQKISAEHQRIGISAREIRLANGSVELAFTCGVLIHIRPGDLYGACSEIHRVSSRYIVCIEYFSATPSMTTYQGQKGKLWKRDFGSFWMDNFDLELMGYGFFWRRVTGLDNLTWWAFEKK